MDKIIKRDGKIVEFLRFKKSDSVDSRYCNVSVTEKEKQLVINFKFDEK